MFVVFFTSQKQKCFNQSNHSISSSEPESLSSTLLLLFNGLCALLSACGLSYAVDLTNEVNGVVVGKNTTDKNEKTSEYGSIGTPREIREIEKNMYEQKMPKILVFRFFLKF